MRKSSRKKRVEKQYNKTASCYKHTEKPFWADHYSAEEWRIKTEVDKGFGNGVQEEGWMSSLELLEMVI